MHSELEKFPTRPAIRRVIHENIVPHLQAKDLDFFFSDVLPGIITTRTRASDVIQYGQALSMLPERDRMISARYALIELSKLKLKPEQWAALHRINERIHPSKRAGLLAREFPEAIRASRKHDDFEHRINNLHHEIDRCVANYRSPEKPMQPEWFINGCGNALKRFSKLEQTKPH